MKLLVLTYILVPIISALAQEFTVEKPTITWPTEKETFLQQGDELRIDCLGEGNLTISRQELAGNVGNRTEFKILRHPNNSITFLIPQVAAADAGWYACAKTDKKIRNDEQTVDHPETEISWIYVWVDWGQPFSVMHEKDNPQISAIAGNSVVIPCRPTRFDTNVTIFIKRSPPDPAEVNFTCTPKIGCIIRNVKKSAFDEPDILCIANGNHSEVYTPMYKILISDMSTLSELNIHKDLIPHVVWGEDATLHCNVTTLQESLIEWKWFYPNSIPEKEISPHSDEVVVDGSKYYRTSLTIRNVKKHYAGNYTCCVTDIKNETMLIEIWDPNHHYIKFTPQDNSTTISTDEKTEARWSFEIDSYPNVELTWLKNTEKIDVDSGEYEHTSMGYTHHFAIKSTAMHHSGNYTVIATTPYNISKLVLYLTVKVAPVIQKIETSLPYYKLGQTAVITCQAIGSPVPNATWRFEEWVTETTTCSRECPVTSSKNTINNDTFSLESTYEMRITMMGSLTCIACNLVACVEKNVTIFITEIDGDGFFGTIKPTSLIEGDNVTIICAASVYNYTENIDWTKKDNESLLNLAPRITIERSTGSFTKRSLLKIQNLTKTDAGNYVCKAQSKKNGSQLTYYKLEVEESKKTSIYDTNLNNLSLPINAEKYNKATITLFCKVTGKPIPHITWLHDGKIITNASDQFELSEDNTVLDIKTAFVRESHGGEYKCIAKNRINSEKRKMKVLINAKGDKSAIWISLVCFLIMVIVIVITHMYIKMKRERALRIELNKAGLTHFIDGAPECLNFDLTVDEQAELLPYDPKWEFPKERLKIGKQLGSGAFGVVMRAEARGICAEEEVTTVAVKMVRRSADPSYMKALASELKIMIYLGRHLNVVNLLGACTKTILTKRELYVIVEYCRYGNVHKYLQLHREAFIDQIDPVTQMVDSSIGMELLQAQRESTSNQNRTRPSDMHLSRSVSVTSSDNTSGVDLIDYRTASDFDDINISPDGGVRSNNSAQPGWRSNYQGDYKDQNLEPICTQDLLCWAWQVSRGMEYLGSRNVLHGDLAARNILLVDDNIVKICDFGLAKNMYKDANYKKKGDGPLPLKWMAIESIKDGTFSTQSDIWSFGIVLWEFFTLARTPYPGMEAEKQYDRLNEGYRMDKPEYATDELYALMLYCWNENPSLRPTFPELAKKIGSLLSDSVKSHISDLNSPYMEMNAADRENGQNDYLTMMSSPDHKHCNHNEAVDNNYVNSTAVLSPPSGSQSNYLSMSSIKGGGDSDIFSPREIPEKLHFNFLVPEETNEIAPPSQNSTESGSKLGTKGVVCDLQQDKVVFVDEENRETSIAMDPVGYCNVQIHHEKHSKPDEVRSVSSGDKSGEDSKVTKSLQVNIEKDLSPPVISVQQNNYVNMPKNKLNLKLKDAPKNAYNNPNYIGLSAVTEAK